MALTYCLSLYRVISLWPYDVQTSGTDALGGLLGVLKIVSRPYQWGLPVPPNTRGRRSETPSIHKSETRDPSMLVDRSALDNSNSLWTI